MRWLMFAFSAIFFLGIYNFILKNASTKINSLLALPIFAAIACLTGIIFLTILKTTNGQTELLFTREGAIITAIAGLFWAVGQVFFFSMFSQGAPLSVGGPIVLGGLIVATTVLGIVILKEPLTLQKLLGIVAILAGYVLLVKK